MKKASLLFLVLLLTIGCGGKWVDCRPLLASSKSPVRYDKSYKLNSVENVNIGNPILAVTVWDFSVPHYYIAATSPSSLSLNCRWKFRTYTVNIKSYFAHRINSFVEIDGKIYFIAKVNGDWGILISESGKALNSCIYSFYDSMLFYPDEPFPIPGNITFTLAEVGKKDLIYELIYSGRNDVSLNFTYREFTGEDLARPAFYQNVTYQAAARQIQFKSFTINILEASNEKITYSISDDGSNSWR